MELPDIRLVDGTCALSPVEQIEAELAKDRWDARKIPGLRYAPHTNDYYVRFQCVPERFRPVVKDYARFQLAAGRSSSTLRESVYYLGGFLTFFIEQYPDAHTFSELTERDVDTFITSLRATINKKGKPMSNGQIGDHVLRLDGFLHYLERCHSPLRPKLPAESIVWPHHYPKQYRIRRFQELKYIPQSVLAQLDSHLQDLTPSCIPIVILLRASGWRISDVLYLKLDTCLEQDNEKFWLVGDIQKTRVLGHKIPITMERDRCSPTRFQPHARAGYGQQRDQR